ncbi:MAG: hypothetical protein ACREEB_10365 [Caulobacteraceae bacterium]
MSDQLPEAPGRGARLVGILLMVAGALVAVLCGLCSLAVVGSGGVREGSGALSWDLVVAIVGGIPTLAGIVTFAIGLIIFRQRT